MKKEKYVLKGYLARLNEYEDDGIALFSDPHGDCYVYRDKELVDVVEFVQEKKLLGKKIKITFEVIE